MDALRLLWRDDHGIIVSITLILFSSIVVIGLLSSYATLRNTVLSELSGVGSSAQKLNQAQHSALSTTVFGVNRTIDNDFSEVGFPANRPANCILVIDNGN